MAEQGTQTAVMEPPVKTGNERERVQELLDRLAKALVTGDGRTVASMWATPAFVLGDEGAQVVNTLEEVETFFGDAKDQYNARGIVDTRAEITRLDRVSDKILMVDVRWPYLDKAGKEVGTESSTYTLMRDDAGDLKLRMALMRGAEAPR